MKLGRVALSTSLVALAAAAPALAEPAFAVRTGYSCSTCHVNRTGGGLRTPFGSLYTQTILPARLLPLPPGKNLLPANPDARYAVGADVRFRFLAVERERADDSSSFELSAANVYGELRLLPRRMSLYLDERVGPEGASSRELFALFRLGGSWNGYVKAGKFLPAYGWRLPDDDAFIRQFTGFTYSAPDIGIELGAEPKRWTVNLAVHNGAGGGSDDNNSKQLTLRASRRFDAGRIGVAASNNVGDGFTTTVAGVFGGTSFGRLTLLGEGDWVQTSSFTATDTRWAGLLEADVLIARGLNLKLAHDWFDPDRDVSTDARTRDSIGLEYVPFPFLQLRWFVRFQDGPPQLGGVRDDHVDVELHVFF